MNRLNSYYVVRMLLVIDDAWSQLAINAGSRCIVLVLTYKLLCILNLN